MQKPVDEHILQPLDSMSMTPVLLRINDVNRRNNIPHRRHFLQFIT